MCIKLTFLKLVLFMHILILQEITSVYELQVSSVDPEKRSDFYSFLLQFLYKNLQPYQR